MKTISTIIPAYNAGLYIGEAIQSIQSQTSPVSEIIVIDDGSVDNTASVIKTFSGIRYFHQPHSGIAAALNAGVCAATGEWLAFLDADDVWTPDRISLQLDLLARDPELEILFGYVRQFLSPDLSEEEKKEIIFNAEPMRGIHKSAMLVKRDAFDKVGMFGGRFLLEEFSDWFARSREVPLREEMLPDVIAHRRIHRTNISRTQKTMKQDFPKILKAALDRRRKIS